MEAMQYAWRMSSRWPNDEVQYEWAWAEATKSLGFLWHVTAGVHIIKFTLEKPSEKI
jgi:hypothetical protein